MCPAPFAMVWKAGGTWYHPRNILLHVYETSFVQYSALHIWSIQMYTHAWTCSGSHRPHCVHSLATSLELWRLDECRLIYYLATQCKSTKLQMLQNTICCFKRHITLCIFTVNKSHTHILFNKAVVSSADLTVQLIQIKNINYLKSITWKQYKLFWVKNAFLANKHNSYFIPHITVWK